MDLIYYYPWRADAPSNVARNVFKYLVKREKELPFENIKLFTSSKYEEWVRKQFGDSGIITYKDLNKESKNCIIHIPVSPLIYPNAKFLLHVYAMLGRKKLILQYHGDIRTEMRLKLKYEPYLISYIPTYIAMPFLLRKAGKVITHSYLMLNLIKSKYGVKNSVVIPNGIDDFWFDESDETNIELNGEPSLFYHGKLSPEKGVDLLIKGFSKIIGKNSKAKLYIAADGPQQKYLKNLCKKLGIEKNIVCLGFINKKGIKSYLKSVDAAIYPSIWDNFPLTFMEAFSSAKCPVYFSKQAGTYDFVVGDGYNLNAFKPTVGTISKIIEDVIDGNYDEGIVKKQKEFARRYGWDKVIGQYIKQYNQMCSI